MPSTHEPARILPALLIVCAALLAGCGGSSSAGSETRSPTVDSVPPDAVASAEAFTGYVAAQVDDDQREPIGVDGVVPPTSETAEPLPVTR